MVLDNSKYEHMSHNFPKSIGFNISHKFTVQRGALSFYMLFALGGFASYYLYFNPRTFFPLYYNNTETVYRGKPDYLTNSVIFREKTSHFSLKDI